MNNDVIDRLREINPYDEADVPALTAEREARFLRGARLGGANRVRRYRLMAAAAALVLGIGLIAGWLGGSGGTDVTDETPATDPGTVASTVATTAALPEASTTTSVAATTLPAPQTIPGYVCPVSVPSESEFTLPEGSEDLAPPQGTDWFGNPSIWTRLETDGANWLGLPRTDDGLTQVLFVWVDGLTADVTPDSFTLSLQRLDVVDSEPLSIDANVSTGSTGELGLFLTIRLSIPEPGCWQFDVELQGHSLTFVAAADGR